MASKGKKDKHLKSTPEIEIDTVQKDIVPGKLSEKEWNELISTDEGIGIVYELLGEIVEEACDILYNHHLEREIYPYAVKEAKKTILKIIDLQFVARDPGELYTESDPSWLPDEEPVPPKMDSWGCGAVPLVSEESISSSIEPGDQMKILENERLLSPVEQYDSSSMPSRSIISSPTATLTATPTSENKQVHVKLKRQPVLGRPQVRMVALDKPPPYGGTAEDEFSEEDLQQSQRPRSPFHIPDPLGVRPSSAKELAKPAPFGLKPAQIQMMKEVKYDRYGNIVEMLKLDPNEFPSHRTRTNVSVIRPLSDLHSRLSKYSYQLKPLPKTSIANKPKKSSLKSRQSRFKAGLELDSDEEDAGPPKPGPQRKARVVLPSATGLSRRLSSKRFPEKPTIPSMVDTIDPLPGVTVIEGERSVQGPAHHYLPPTSPRHKLRPVKPLEEDEDGDDHEYHHRGSTLTSQDRKKYYKELKERQQKTQETGGQGKRVPVVGREGLGQGKKIPVVGREGLGQGKKIPVGREGLGQGRKIPVGVRNEGPRQGKEKKKKNTLVTKPHDVKQYSTNFVHPTQVTS